MCWFSTKKWQDFYPTTFLDLVHPQGIAPMLIVSLLPIVLILFGSGIKSLRIYRYEVVGYVPLYLPILISLSFVR